MIQENTMENYYDHYHLFCNNINPSLKRELGIEINTTNILYSDWKPPNKYGLDNSERTIPQHYLERNDNITDIVMFYDLTKDIEDEFDAVRNGTIALFRSFSFETLMAVGTSPGGIVTVNSVGYMICGHSQHHLNIIKERYLKK
jgi:hypothetical protein